MTLSRFIRQEVLDIPTYQVHREEGAVKLNQNESPWDIPTELKMKILERFLKMPWQRYGAVDLLALKKRMAPYLGVWPDELALANGSNVLIQAILLATAVGEKVMTLSPTFSVYALQAKILGNQVVEVPLLPDFSLDLKAVLTALNRHKPKVLFIANPNAPTGNAFAEEDLVKIVEAARCPVVIDEAYYPFSDTTLFKVRKRFGNLIVLRTFSKAYAMAGLRFGFLVADVELAAQINKVLLPFCLSTLTECAVLSLLEDPGWVLPRAAEIVKEREWLYAAMKEIEGIEVFSSRTNFIAFRVSNARAVFRQLLKRRVLVRDIGNDHDLKNCLRVSVGTREENSAFLAALREIGG